MFFDGFADKGQCRAGGGHQAAGFTFVLPHALVDVPGAQADWRFCQKCSSLFYDGLPEKGACPRGGGHDPAGFLFLLPHSQPETAASQEDWRYCHKCAVMFFDGFAEKGTCPGGGGHEAAGLNFVLPHDMAETPIAQASWRYCGKCRGMFYDGSADKGACPVGGGHEAVGFNFVLPHDIREPFTFSGQLVSGGLAALGGQVAITVNPDGTVRWQGHGHDSGTDGYDYSVSALVRTPFGDAVAVAHSGHVGGTLTAGDRDDPWDQPYAIDPSLALHFAFGQIQTNLQYTSDFGSALSGLVDWALKFAAGAVAGPGAGLVIFLGVEAGSLISTGSLVPGARIVDGVLWMAGPGNTLFALAAAGIASVGSRTRELTQEEYDWANAQVYQDALPPRETLVLTDTIGPGNRAFTFPRFDGKITINMGPQAFDNPRGEANIFIHELLHSVQIEYSKSPAGLLAGALAAKVCEATGGNPYHYPMAPLDYQEQGLEAQAQIVSDWYSGNAQAWNNQTATPMDQNSPYFTYIVKNVRTRDL